MLIDDVAKVAARLDAGNVDEDAILAETRLQALEQAASLPLAIIASVTNEDARHPRDLRPKSQEFSHVTRVMSLVPFGSVEQEFQRKLAVHHPGATMQSGWLKDLEHTGHSGANRVVGSWSGPIRRAFEQ